MARIAVIGCGQWGRNLVRNFNDIGVLTKVCDVNSEALASIASIYPRVGTTTEFDSVLEDREIDGVAIAAPAVSHYSLAKAALLAGKDVFVEKPLALNTSDGGELLELAKTRKRVLMVGHLLRYHPAVLKLKALIDEGALGKLLYVYSNRLNLGKFRTEENILWSFAPHDISAILYLLGEVPASVATSGGTYLTAGIPDVTVTTLNFQSGVKGHIFVSWLHPHKEQKLVVVGDRRMAVFDALEPQGRLLLLNNPVEWRERQPVAHKETAETIPLPSEEPLKKECQHFVECITTRRTPFTDGEEGLRVLRVLELCQQSLDGGGALITKTSPPKPYMVHETAMIDQPCQIGAGTQIWHFSHVMKNASIGQSCTIGQNAFIAADVKVGNRVKIQNNVSLYTGVVFEDDVFCGPSVVFTNVTNPRSHVSRRHEYRETIVQKGASIGANATIVCGHTIGRYAFVGAGAVVTKDVPAYALVVGNPARAIGWMCECGIRLKAATGKRSSCPDCQKEYIETADGLMPAGAKVAAG